MREETIPDVACGLSTTARGRELRPRAAGRAVPPTENRRLTSARRRGVWGLGKLTGGPLWKAGIPNWAPRSPAWSTRPECGNRVAPNSGLGLVRLGTQRAAHQLPGDLVNFSIGVSVYKMRIMKILHECLICKYLQQGSFGAKCSWSPTGSWWVLGRGWFPSFLRQLAGVTQGPLRVLSLPLRRSPSAACGTPASAPSLSLHSLLRAARTCSQPFI